MEEKVKCVTKIYAAKDIVVGEFGVLMQFDTEERARRSFELAVKNAKNTKGINSNDYQLFKIGEFNEETGEFTPELNFIQQGISKDKEDNEE